MLSSLSRDLSSHIQDTEIVFPTRTVLSPIKLVILALIRISVSLFSEGLRPFFQRYYSEFSLRNWDHSSQRACAVSPNRAVSSQFQGTEMGFPTPTVLAPFRLVLFVLLRMTVSVPLRGTASITFRGTTVGSI